MRALVSRPLPTELSQDRRFARRVKRLGVVSLVALGLVWWLAAVTLDAPTPVGIALAAGWALMPITLFASLAIPMLRYGLVLPAGLVSIGLLAISGWWLPSSAAAATGWVLVTAGVALGGVLGLWFWYRLLPVPAALDDPYSRGRWALIGIHVALITLGLLLAATGL
ncbi:MAG TPA: hypothetical protein VF136_06425 [Methylomirabilota bacterium]